MRLYHRSRDDKEWGISRCHFDAEHSRVGLALDRLGDLSDEFPDDAQIVYAEGVIRRDFLGQGLVARELFERAYRLDDRHWSAAVNATLLARDEEEFRKWAGVFQAVAPAGEPGLEFIAGLLDNLDEWMRCWQMHGYAAQAAFEAKQFGPSAANTELLLLTGAISPVEEVGARRNRAQCLRALDREAHQYRESIREDFNPAERLALHEAVAEIERAIGIDESDAELWNLKSAWCLFLNRIEEAVESAERAIELRPFHYPKPYTNKAVALAHLGKNSEALACVRKALEEAEKSASAADAAQARRLIDDFTTPSREPSLHELEEPIIRHILNSARITADLEVGLLPSRSIEKLIKGFTGRALKIRSGQSLDYVPLVAELLSDFTPDTAYWVVLKSSDYSQSMHEHCMHAALHVAAHSDGVRQRDATRFLALSFLGAMRGDEIRRVYRQAILETSAAASDEMAHLDAIMRDELKRINHLFPRLIAKQAPVAERERERADHNIISRFSGKAAHVAQPHSQRFDRSVGPDLRPTGLSGRPPLTKGGVIFNAAMQAAPFIGLGMGWLIGRGSGAAVGFLTGVVVACVGWIYFFFVRNHPGTRCEVCGQRFIKGPASPPLIDNVGVMFSTAGMLSGAEGPGDECVKCGRIFCTSCARTGAECECGSTRFRTVRLIYR
jgi:tetratricopeptide (TPR) repeat protein